MRIWIALAIALSFCLQGWAATWAQAAPCPMETQMQATVAQDTATQSDTAADVLAPDCCNEIDTYLLTGQACKTGQDCQSTFSVMLQLMDETPAVAVSQAVPSLYGPAVLPPLAVAVWRPPTTH